MTVLSRRSLLAGLSGAARGKAAPVLDAAAFRRYFGEFNLLKTPDVESYVPDEKAFEWAAENCPLFACPDAEAERTYYYRWWSLRKHLRRTPAGYIFTEFLHPVKHATDYNAISCALGHHVMEARWLRETAYLDEYLRFWLNSGEGGGLQRAYHQYSNWTAWAAYQRWLADGRTAALLALYPALRSDYAAWESERGTAAGLFWQFDVRDGMEESISGGRKARNLRPTINSYMYGNAWAMERIARLAGREAEAAEYGAKARRLRALVQDQLWDPEAQFYKTRLEGGALADVREAIGFTPWYFGLPEAGRGHEAAWAELMDPKGFDAPYGPTTAEQRHPGFRIAESGDDCQWNGPGWPFATTITLVALANVLHGGVRTPAGVEDYFRLLMIYARSQRLRLADGRVAAFVDENLNPFTGEWHARARKIKKGTFYGRGDHYNHSAFCDLVITGLCGLRPEEGGKVTVNPLLPRGGWAWFCLENVTSRGRKLTVVWDRDGRRFGRDAGLSLYADGDLLGRRRGLGKLEAKL
jgi:hypothetical protein